MTDLSWMMERLAELCGVTIITSSFEQYDPSGWKDRDGIFHQGKWHPDLDVSQAIRCLESLGPMYHWTIRPREVSITKICEVAWNPTHVVFTASVPQNIVRAIAAALGWETPDVCNVCHLTEHAPGCRAAPGGGV